MSRRPEGGIVGNVATGRGDLQTETGDFYIGARIEGSERTEPVIYDSDDLVRHGVIVGMTGSGKTGLGIDLLEEALLSNIPCLIIDPKGDMGNLRLIFPEFRPEDFAPWIDPAEAERDGKSVDEAAAVTATTWRDGLADWDIASDRMRRIVDGASVTIYTPGSSAGVPLNVVGSLSAPPLSWDEHAETLRDEIEGFVSSLLVLVDIKADPVSSPPHILLSTLIENEWRAGRDLDLASLVAMVPDPPIRKLGVFQLEEFYPKKDRIELAKRLNGLLASPSFAAWLEGPPLDIEALLTGDRTPAPIIYLAHLSEPERQFVVTLVLSKLVTWMRRQSGAGRLRLLVYMDEVYGFAPPVAEPPAKKQILTLLKQARAYGVGLLLATQNPVDLDYKAMSNAGTWMIGRLQTENDKKRILEGLADAGAGTDIGAIDTAISNLGSRQFVMREMGSDEPAVFQTRWAMSYLAGPIDRRGLERLRDGGEDPTSSATPEPRPDPVEEPPPDGVPDPTVERPDEAVAPEPAPQETSALAPDDALAVMPSVAKGVEAFHLDPAAPWAAEVGAVPTPTHRRAVAVAAIDLLYDDRYAEVDHRETYEVVIDPLTSSFDAGSLRPVDHDPRDFRPVEPDGIPYAIPEAPIGEASFWKGLSSSLQDHLVAERRLQIWKNPKLKLYSRVGESRDEFEKRCSEAAEDAADRDLANLRNRFAKRIDSAKSQISKADRRVRELQADVEARRQQELVSGVGDLLGSLIGGRSRSGAVRRAASRRSQTQRTAADLESALARLSEEERELAELEAELADAVEKVVDEWSAHAGTIEEVEIPLERSDVKVSELRLVWVPTARPSAAASDEVGLPDTE